MAETPTKVVVDCSTGQTKIIPLSQEEIAENEAQAAELQALSDSLVQKAEELEANKASAISKLTDLGLTEAEALALVGQ